MIWWIIPSLYVSLQAVVNTRIDYSVINYIYLCWLKCWKQDNLKPLKRLYNFTICAIWKCLIYPSNKIFCNTLVRLTQTRLSVIFFNYIFVSPGTSRWDFLAGGRQKLISAVLSPTFSLLQGYCTIQWFNLLWAFI